MPPDAAPPAVADAIGMAFPDASAVLAASPAIVSACEPDPLTVRSDVRAAVAPGALRVPVSCRGPERATVAAGDAPKAVPDAIGIGSSDAPPALTEPLAVALESGAELLTECSVGCVAVAPSLGSRALCVALSFCAKERSAVTAGDAPEGVPDVIEIRSPDAPPVLTELLAFASGAGAALLSECSVVRAAVAPSLGSRALRVAASFCAKERSALAAGDAPEGVPDAIGIGSPDAPPVLTELLAVASASDAAVLTSCSVGRVAVAPSLGSRALRVAASFCTEERSTAAAGDAPEAVPDTIGMRSPDAPPVLTEPLAVASGSDAAVLTECSVVRVAVAPSPGSRALRVAASFCTKERAAVAAGDAPEGVPDAIGMRSPDAPPVLTWPFAVASGRDVC
jgi:hypothetical protein